MYKTILIFTRAVWLDYSLEGFGIFIGGNIPGGGRKDIIAVIAAGLGGGNPRGGIPGGKVNAHGGTIAGMPGLGGTIFGFIRRGTPIGNGVLPNFPDLYAAVVWSI